MNFFEYEFIRNAFIGGFLLSIISSLIGTFIVLRRLVLATGGISHSAFGGIGLGFLLGVDPVLGALLFSVLSSLLIGFITKKTRLPEDISISIIWAFGMALGVIFTSFSGKYVPELLSYLFGNILLISNRDILFMLIFSAFLILFFSLFGRELFILSFDEDFGKTLGIRGDLFYFLFLSLVGVSVILLMRAVGIILVIALLSIPTSISIGMARSLGGVIFLSFAFSLFFIFSGLTLSIIFDLPSGAFIIILSCFTFFLLRLFSGRR